MIDEYSLDGTGWARFSDDRRMRFRLARSLDGRELYIVDGRTIAYRSVVFLMLNPSTADAFKLDPTVSKCCQFARRWGADVLEVVNLFALRSPDPRDLDIAHAHGEQLGDDADADAQILEACASAARVIAAWGAGGVRHGRADAVAELLAQHSIRPEHLGTTKAGHPLHPLARGRSWIPLDREPRWWT
ncbi:MAG: DUF1643 domain-containing protein [Kofleriaceae bacterium]